MTEQEFLDHHGLSRNPFSDEDAQTDAVFKERCIDAGRHPAWSKVYGDPAHPGTAVVLGPKGSGKTAMRLQLVRSFQKFNTDHPESRVFYVQYDDFNRYLGPFEQHLPERIRSVPEKVLAALNVWDHLDAILCEVTTHLVDQVIKASSGDPSEPTLAISTEQITKLDRAQRRDLVLLSACYDQPRRGSFPTRQNDLRRKLRFIGLSTWRWLGLGALGSAVVILVMFILYRAEALSTGWAIGLAILGMAACWFPYGLSYVTHFYAAWRVVRRVRVARRDIRSLCRAFMQVPSVELAGQPLPVATTSDSRYAMLDKLQSILRTLNFHGLIVLVDRVDEPELVNGHAERMKGLVWPMLDNKLLKHPGLGVKLLLPSDLQYFLDRESREFHERARLDKQNLIGNFDWTGEALFDVVVARMKACSEKSDITPMILFDNKVSEARLLLAFQTLRTPRNLFRFLYRLIAEHCKMHRSTEPVYRISSENLEATLAVFQSELSRSA
jgi:hypothetical protein